MSRVRGTEVAQHVWQKVQLARGLHRKKDKYRASTSSGRLPLKCDPMWLGTPACSSSETASRREVTRSPQVVGTTEAEFP